MPKPGRMGGRGCPSCGSHDTQGLPRPKLFWCNGCKYQWTPCEKPRCGGYAIKLTDPDGPKVIGCKDCDEAHGGVPDRVARWWPEAHRRLAAELDERKKLEIAGPVRAPVG